MNLLSISSMPPLVPKRVSLVTQVVDILRDGVDTGLWKDWLPGERVLCERLHVSRPTLRQALNQLQKEGRLRLDPTRRRRILRAKQHPSPGSKLVVLLTPFPVYAAPPLTLFWIDELRDHLIEAGYHLEIDSGERYYRENPRKALASLVHRTRAAGWVLWLSTSRMQQWFADENIPCLVMGSSFRGIDVPSLDLDQRSICRHAAAQFYAKGHKRVAFIIHAGGLAGDLDSAEGVKEAHAKFAGANPPPEIVWHDGTARGIVQKMEALYRSQQPPTAFLVARSATVLTVQGFLLKRGLRFPEDVVLISRDTDPFLEYMIPSVARYALNPKLYARAASRIVTQLAQGEPVLQREVRLTPSFIKGETFS